MLGGLWVGGNNVPKGNLVGEGVKGLVWRGRDEGSNSKPGLGSGAEHGWEDTGVWSWMELD